MYNYSLKISEPSGLIGAAILGIKYAKNTAIFNSKEHLAGTRTAVHAIARLIT